MDQVQLVTQTGYLVGTGKETIILSVVAAVLAIQFFFLIFLWLRLGTLSKKYKSFMVGASGVSLEDKLIELLKARTQQEDNIKGLHFSLRELEQDLKYSVQHVGVVRFNAFPDAGSDLSFSIAVLDGNNDGFVLSSIYGRDESRVYAKPITKGISDYLLSDEEKKAIANGLRN